MRSAGVMVAMAMVSCGSGLPRSPWRDRPAEPLIKASGDAKRLRGLLHAPVTYAGLLFEDPDCMRQFAAPGELGPDRLDSFATCLARLKFEPGARHAAVHGVSVVSYAPGLEVEARLEDGPHGPALQWIGFVGRHDVHEAMPTITSTGLESLRTAGDAHGTLSGETRRRLDQERGDDRSAAAAAAWLKICLDSDGQVTSAQPIAVTSALALDAFGAAVIDWRFRPLLFAGHAVPACAYVRLSYPSLADDAAHPQMLPVALFGPRDRLIVDERALGKRIAGTELAKPNAATEAVIDEQGVAPFLPKITFCVDEAGAVGAVTLAESSGNAPWDAQMMDLVRQWRYAPFLLHGKATAVCSATQMGFPASISGPPASE